MARNRKADSSSDISLPNDPTNSMTSGRRQSPSQDPQQDVYTSATNLKGKQDHVVKRSPKTTEAKVTGDMDGLQENQQSGGEKGMSLAGRFFVETIPAVLAVGGMLGLIFGGCCSNVFALEAIVNVEPDSGTLLTFVQFLFVAVTGYFSQFDSSRPPFFLRPNRVPIRRWLVNIVLFFTINVLNNHAFSYSISVPIHIILRSGGSITTLVAGYLWGKRFSRIQVLAVTLLTIGVVIAAWSDQASKEEGKAERERPPFSTGLAILFLAQILSAIMGLYTEETYKQYGPHWKENLFYSHLLALPLFIPFLPAMERQFEKLAASPPLGLPKRELLARLPVDVLSSVDKLHVPSQLAYMVINVLTQYACIRGVNLLASAASALTVTIVLNIRKLVSLLLSIWLFGNKLSPGTLIGACIVFGSGALYGLKIEGNKSSPAGRSHRAASVSNARRESEGNGKIG